MRRYALLLVLALASCESTPAPSDEAVQRAADGSVDSGRTEDAAVREDAAALDAEAPDASDATRADAASQAGSQAAGAGGAKASGAGAGGSGGVAAVGGVGGGAGQAGVGGSAGAGQAGAVSVPRTGSSFIRLDSEAGDYVGQGQLYMYTLADSVFTIAVEAGRVTVAVHGDQRWDALFALPADFSELRTGTFNDLGAYPSQDVSRGGLNWRGEGRACGQLTGWIAIDAVEYDAGTLKILDLRFEQKCKGSTAALRGQIHWVGDDPTLPPGPITPVASDLWRAPAGVTPASGNYVYLLSEPGHYVGGGLGYVYTQADALITLTAIDGNLTIRVEGEEDWTGHFATMLNVRSLQPGYYGCLRSGPANPARGTLEWSGEARGCETRNSWFVVDQASYEAGALTALDLRFEHHCEGTSTRAALHGQIHWRADDRTAPPAPVKPVPTNLWRAAGNGLPVAGSYVYLESQAGDTVGAGKTYLYTQANAILSIVSANSHISVMVTGDEEWLGRFEAMSGITALEPAYHANARSYPFGNPTRPGLDWIVDGRNCSKLEGWLAIDRMTYEAGALTALEFRFEQRCVQNTGALHGQVRWVANDPTRPPGPVNPPPSDLWKPATAALPASGNYVYLESQAGDFIGGGQTFTYTSATPLTLTTQQGGVTAMVADWSGAFFGMAGLEALTVGYYGGLGNGSFGNPTRGSLNWSGQGRGCNRASGWFVVDRIVYASGSISELDLRFEQHCEDMSAALHGAIHVGGL